jgi:hypothetical protein
LRVTGRNQTESTNTESSRVAHLVTLPILGVESSASGTQCQLCPARIPCKSKGPKPKLCEDCRREYRATVARERYRQEKEAAAIAHFFANAFFAILTRETEEAESGYPVYGGRAFTHCKDVADILNAEQAEYLRRLRPTKDDPFTFTKLRTAYWERQLAALHDE